MQQLFRLSVFLNQSNIFRATNPPIFRSTFWLYIQLLVQCTDSFADRCHGWDGTCILLVVHVGVLMMHGHTNIEYSFFIWIFVFISRRSEGLSLELKAVLTVSCYRSLEALNWTQQQKRRRRQQQQQQRQQQH